MGELRSARSDDFADLVRPHTAAMEWLAARMAPAADREDVVQEALLKAWRQGGQFDPQRGSRRTWLLMLTAEAARKAHRSRRTTATDPDLGYLDDPADVDLELAVRRLPRRQRLAIALHYFLDLPMNEVAAVMGCAEGTVKATLSQARTRLRRQLGKDFPWTP